jgi:hypothetical protein
MTLSSKPHPWFTVRFAVAPFAQLDQLGAVDVMAVLRELESAERNL